MAALNIYTTGVGRNRRVSRHFAKGSGGKIVPPAPLLDGDMFSYGCLRGILPTLRQAQAEGRTWFYADNGYFGSGPWGYFRITRNALQCDGTGSAGPERWNRLGLTIKPWRKSGSHILVIVPEPLSTELWGVDPHWAAKVVAELKRHTDRPIVIRRKIADKLQDGAPPLAVALEDAWAVVCWTSNVAVESLLAGVPVYCTAACAAYRMGTPDLAQIENPVMPDDREQWAWNLAANQWSLQEMADGTCWRELQAR